MKSLIALTVPSFGVPLGIDAHAGDRAVAHPPEHPEAVPLAVGRNVRVEPALTVGHRLVVVGAGPEPRRRALEQEQLADARRDLGDELHRAGTGADHRDALARQIDGRDPTARSGTTRRRRCREPGISGKCGRLSCPTALTTAFATSVSSRAVGVAHDDGPRRGRSSTTWPNAPRCGTGCGRAHRTRRRSRGSTRAARAGRSSGAASRGAARTSSCSCGSGCRPDTPDTCSRTTCRRRRRSSRPPCSRRRLARGGARRASPTCPRR